MFINNLLQIKPISVCRIHFYMKEFKDIDLYLLLETTQNATKDDIKKAYRKKALKCHPDKNPNNPHATKIFHQLQHALAILIDDAARKAYDNILRARKANELKNSQLDEKRKRLKQQLEERESQCKIYSNNANYNTVCKSNITLSYDRVEDSDTPLPLRQQPDFNNS